jgi:ribonuclease P protein component
VPERYPFPPTARVRSKSEYTRVFSQGERIWGKHFTGYVFLDAASETRLGLVVSRKVGQAVVRNRVKRLIREFFRRNRRRFPQGMQVVVIARESSKSLDGETCAVELERLFGKHLRGA